MPRTKLSTKGQVILPKPVRDAMHWAPGTELEVERQADCVVLRQVRPAKRYKLEDIIGILKHDGPPISDDEIRKAAAEGAVARYERSLK